MKVDVGGYGLAVRCTGEGRPVAILEAGHGLASGRWLPVLRRVRSPRVCAYDRAGLGRSDEHPPGVDRTPVEDLHALVENTAIDPPFVLVGHSAGGAYAAFYARVYPGEAAGIVFVDAAHPGFEPGSLGDMPIVVLERGIRPPEWSDVQTSLAALSSNSVHAVVPETGHHVQAGRPQAVIAAIQAVVRATRRESQLPPCERIFSGLRVECVS